MRISLIACVALLAACSKGVLPDFVFPNTAADWKLVTARSLIPQEAPESIVKIGMNRAQTAEYEILGGRITAQVYEMTTAAAAFELEQTWRPQVDTVVLHKENRFAVVRWFSAPRTSVYDFVKVLEKQLER
jgi:hypothetical protein